MFWEANNMVCVIDGKRWTVNRLGQSVIVPLELLKADATLQDNDQDVTKPLPDTLDGVIKNVTDKCEVCGGTVVDKRADSRFCSNKCRQKHYRGGKQLSMVVG